MSKLPRVNKPLFELLIPSQKTKVKARPFVVREEKILLMAQQSGIEKEIVLAVKQVINNCIEDPQFNVDSLTTFDLEYMFLKLRARSVNNVIELSYRDNDDNKTYEFTVDLDDVDMSYPENYNDRIQITDEVGIVMKYPSITLLDNAPDNVSPTELVEYLIRSCIDYIYDADTVYPTAEYSETELTDFIDSLDVNTFTKIREFFDSLPKLYYKITYNNANGEEKFIELTTLSDFFTWE